MVIHLFFLWWTDIQTIDTFCKNKFAHFVSVPLSTVDALISLHMGEFQTIYVFCIKIYVVLNKIRHTNLL